MKLTSRGFGVLATFASGKSSDQKIKLKKLTISGGDGDEGYIVINTPDRGKGNDLKATIGDDASEDELDVTSLENAGGNSDVKTREGGDADVIINSKLIVGEDGLTVTGGRGKAGDAGNVGGAASLTVNSAVSWATTNTISVAGGENDAEGSGGAATLELKGGIDAADSDLKITGGNGGGAFKDGEASHTGMLEAKMRF